MSDRLRKAARRTIEESAVVAAARRLAAMSVRRAVTAAGWLRQTRARIVAGVTDGTSASEQRRTAERFEALVANSRVLTRLSSIMDAPAEAFHHARLTTSLHRVLALDLETRVRMAASVIVIAALTHTVLLGVVGVPVQALGWSVRAGLIAAGLAVAWRPATIAAAWRDRFAPAREHHGGS